MRNISLMRLPMGANIGSIVGTTKTNGGNRSRYQCGIFLSQIPINGYRLTAYAYHSELAVRATRGNKADSIRTNNAGLRPLELVVDPLPRLLSVGKSFSNNPTEKPTMKIYSHNHRTFADNRALSVSDVMGANNA